MNRNVFLLGVAIAVVAISTTAFVAVYYYTLERHGLAPITWEEMNKLQETGDAAAAEMPKLLACFEIDDEELRVKAAETLGMIGAKAVEPVRAKLKHKNPKVRYCALQALTFLGPKAAAAADDVRGCMKDANSDVRMKAAFTLGRLDVKTDPVVESLVGGLGDADEQVAQISAESLELLGPAAAPALYRVLAAKKDAGRDRIVSVLIKLGPLPKDALPILSELVKDPSQAIRGNSMKLLGQLGKDAVPAFKDLLKTGNPDDYTDVTYGIVELGGDAKALLPELSAYLAKRPYWDADPESMVPFKKSGLAGGKALGELLKTLQGKEKKRPDDRMKIAVRTLGEMGADAKPAVPALIDLLKDQESIRPAVLDALGGIGPAAKEAIPAVQALLKTGNVAQQARVALRRMGVVEKK